MENNTSSYLNQTLDNVNSNEELSIALYQSTRFVCGILLVLIIVSGVFGNILVLIVLRGCSTINDMLIGHLCASDLIGCVVDMPLLAAQFVVNTKGQALLVIGNMNFTVCATIYMLNCVIINLISFSRKEAFSLFDDKVLPKERLRVLLPFSWVVCIGCGIVLAISSTLTGRQQWYLPTKPSYSFGANFIDIGSGCLSVFIVFLTLLNLIWSFITSLRFVKKHNAMLQKTMKADRMDLERKLTRSAVMLTSAFLISWLPWIVVRSVHLITGKVNINAAAYVTVVIGVNHCINPFIYAGNVTEMRVKMLHLLGRVFGKYKVCGCSNSKVKPNNPSIFLINQHLKRGTKTSVVETKEDNQIKVSYSSN